MGNDFMMDARLEQILIRLAQRHAPRLLLQTSKANRQLPLLARQLASYNILILVGEVPYPVSSPDTLARVQTWADGYVRLYSLLTHHLFPSFTHVSAQYADDQLPIVIAIKGAATPVVQALAGYVSPYIAQRQGQSTVSEAELLGLMDTLLEELEASDLPRDEYRHLRADGAAILKEMLITPVKQLLLTPFDRPMFSDLPQPPAPAAPPVLPEAHDLAARVEATTRVEETTVDEPALPLMEIRDTDSGGLPFDTSTSVPIFFSAKPREPKKRRPPVPGLGDDEDDGAD